MAFQKDAGRCVLYFFGIHIGGCLTPVGDPPLLMGFMRNVPFFWSLRLIPIMVLNVVILLVIFYILDSRAYRKDLAEGIVPEVAKGEKEAIRVVGAHNIIFLAAIVVAVILSGILPSTKCIWRRNPHIQEK